MEDMNERLEELQAALDTLGKTYPKQAGAFMAFLRRAEAPGALSVKEKELIAVALSVMAQCSWCVALHVDGALKAGATKEGLMEASFMAAVMSGSPALAHMQLALKASAAPWGKVRTQLLSPVVITG